ncbi:MAG: hypothetical protein Kow00121_54420 [Elainellaceae cyanobacterium]
MNTTTLSNFSISIQQRRCACVLDPTLALSDYGLPLVKQLAELMELWVVRELWHILDNTYFYVHQSRSVYAEQKHRKRFYAEHLEIGTTSHQPQPLSPQAIRALREWERLRLETDLCSLKLFWIGDSVGESLLPETTETGVVWRWETLAQSLEHQLNEHLNGHRANAEILTSAFLDAAALAVALPSAFILTTIPNEISSVDEKPIPRICETLATAGIGCTRIDLSDPIAAIERDQIYHLLVHAGLSKFLWAGLQLAVLHLVVPTAATLNPPQDELKEFSFSEIEEFIETPKLPTNLWQGAQGFWYSIT